MKGIYLGAYTAYHPGYDIVYQDINGLRDLDGDMMDIDLSSYDFIIATPPCNWWTRANYRRNSSLYALKTKHLLPSILYKLLCLSKPFIVENVRNKNLFTEYGLYSLPGCYIKHIGRHTYWTNIDFPCDDLVFFSKRGIQNLNKKDRQGGDEVHEVIERFLTYVDLSLRRL